MRYGLTAFSHNLSLRPGQALRATAIAIGSVALIAAVVAELYAIAIVIAGS
jgi:hypothetical protein